MQTPIEIRFDWQNYIELRDQGLKKQANKVLMNVVKKIEGIGLNYFKGYLYSLCDKCLGGDDSNRIQQPLFVRCILPLLLEDVQAKSTQAIIYVIKANFDGFGREIYNAIGDFNHCDLLKIALETEPNNNIAINLLASDYIDTLYHGAHHLPECLIIDLDTAKSLIFESSEFILKNIDHLDKELVESHRYYCKLYSDYNSWHSGAYSYDFTEWCEKNNREYSWVKSFYYK